MRRDHATKRPAFRRDLARKANPTVEGIEKRILLANFLVKNTLDDPMALDPNSLRSVIMQANAAGGTNTISFNIAASGVQTINLTKPLPALISPVTVDGTSEPGGGTAPRVYLYGAGIVGGGDGLAIQGGNSAVLGLGIIGFSGEGITLTGAGGDTVSGNYIGIAPTGSSVSGNGLDGIAIGNGSNGNTISNNVIGGNKAYGIRLDGTFNGSATSTATTNKIIGNMIGLNAAGSSPLGNGYGGLLIRNAPNSIIGGTTASGTRNNISGNLITIVNGIPSGTGDGIDLYGGSAGTVIAGNYIGTDSGGTTSVGNAVTGIELFAADGVTIGGTATNTGNVISANKSYGIGGTVNTGATVLIEQNLVGTTATGTRGLGNAGDGINLTGNSTTTIGGQTTTTAPNVISANGGNGITIGGTGTLIQGNDIGLGFGGVAVLGNTGSGITANGRALIGGVTTGSATTFGNLIANNASGVTSDTTNVPILFNSIYSNAGLGIQNVFNTPLAPILTQAVSSGNTSRINGSVPAAAGNYEIQFFSSPTGDPEGRTYLGEVMSTGGNTTFSAGVSGFAVPSVITATATAITGGVLGGTSKFSTGITGSGSGPANSPPALSVTSTPATVNAGDNVTYTFTIANTSTVDDNGVVFSDPVPTGTTFFPLTSVTSTKVPVVLTNGVANAQLGTLAAGQSVTVTVVLTTGAGSVPSFKNTAGVTATNPTINPGDDTITSSATTVVAASDLAVSVTGQPASVPVGQNITYTVSISNYGPSDATNVKLTDILPTNTTFASASTSSTNASDAPINSGNTVTANVALIPAGSVVTYTISVQTNGTTPASVTDTATVAGDQVDPDTSTNTASASTIVVPSADVEITAESISAVSVTAGNTVTFTIDLINNGPSPVTGVFLTDTLPSGLNFVSGTAVGGTVTVTNGVVTAPVGNLAVGATSVVTITVLTGAAGTFSDAAVASSADNDPDTNNNSSSASVTVIPVTDVAVALTGPAGPVNINNPLAYTAVVTASGPSPATDVMLNLALFTGANIQSVVVNGVTFAGSGGDSLTQALGTIAVGQSVTVVINLLPTQAGTFTSTATVSTSEPDSNPANNTATLTTVLLVPSPIITFSQGVYTANETDGTAPITLTRVGDLSGTLTVHFSTVGGGNATPGLDYTPISTTVTFAPGQPSAVVNVPVLPDPYDRVDEYVALQLDTPTDSQLVNGATSSQAALRIVNVDPVLVGPTVADLKLYGPASGITGIEIDTTGNLDATTATNTANYGIIALGGGGKNGVPYGRAIPVSLAVYNPATGAVLLIPSTPLPANELFLVVINGTGVSGVSDRAGNPLNSTFGTTPGSNYALNVGRGTNLHYTDENGSKVNLKLSGPGTLDVDQALTGQLGRLQILGATAKTSLTGSVSPKGHRSNIGVITGIGRFGTVLTHLYSPPFTVSNATFPNPANLVNYPSVDTLLPSTAATTTKSKKVTAKAASTVVSHPRTTPVKSTHQRTTH